MAITQNQLVSLNHTAQILEAHHPDMSQRIRDFIKAHSPQPTNEDVGGVHQVSAGDSGSGKDK